MSEEVVSLEALGVDDDPGTAWHPRSDKPDVRDDAGLLSDLDDEQVAEHQGKPEAADQLDAGRPLGAEDSTESPEGEV